MAVATKSQDLLCFADLLESRIESMQSLCDAIRETFPAMMSLDLDSIEMHIRRQSQICNRIAVIDLRLEKLCHIQKHRFSLALDILDSEIDDTLIERLYRLIEQFHSLQNELARLNLTFAELTHRSRISNKALSNVMGQQSFVYANPLERFSVARPR